MRFEVVFISLLTSIAAAMPVHAVDADGSEELRSLAERIFKPDYNKEFPVESYDPGSTSRFADKEFRTKEFHFVDKVRDKEFRTKEFNAGKTAATSAGRLGSKKYRVFSARTGTEREYREADRVYGTDTYATRTYRDSEKEVETRAFHGSDREFKVQGSRQGALDRQYAGQEGMSIEEVREILNKND